MTKTEAFFWAFISLLVAALVITIAVICTNRDIAVEAVKAEAEMAKIGVRKKIERLEKLESEAKP